MVGTVDVSSPALPERTLAQRMEALGKGNRVRSYRKDVKVDIKFGRRDVAEVLAAPEGELASMKVWDLLLAAPGTGRVKANKWLRRAHISPSKTLGGLSERQRGELVALLRGAPAPRRRELRPGAVV